MRFVLAYSLMAGIIVGIFIASVLPSLDITIAWLFLVISLSFIVISKLFSKSLNLIIIAVLVIGVSLGLFRFNLIDKAHLAPNITGKQVVLEGVIVEDPEKRENGTRIVIKEDDSNFRVVATIDLYDEANFGDKVIVEGILESPENFITDTGKVFDYVNYLSARNIAYELKNAHLVEVHGGDWSITRSLFNIKHSFIAKLENFLPEPHSSLGAGLLLGVRSSLGKETEDNFRKTGIIHIVVLSGYNVTIIVWSLVRVLGFLPYFARIGTGALGIVLFAIMVGGGATVVRASIMALFALLAQVTGRIYQVTLGLFFAGFLMVLYNPLLLVFDIGFQLSFLATLGLIFFVPIIEPYLSFITKKLAIRDLVAATIATQIFVLPWLLYKIGELSIVSLPVNLLVLPVIPSAMLFVFITGMLAFISPFLAMPFSYLSYFVLAYSLLVVEFFADLPFSSVIFSSFPLVLVILFYMFYFYIVYRRDIHKSKVVSSSETTLDNL